MPSCTTCNTIFTIFEEDLLLLKQFDTPPPSQCPPCRHQHRAMFKGTMRLHKRISNLSGDSIISIFPEVTPFPVYSIDEWWGDDWDPQSYSRDYDFSRPFFEQFEELFHDVPKIANFNENCENAEYSAYAGGSKNAYYCQEVYRSEDMYYSRKCSGYNQNLCDCLRCQGSSYLYECVQCAKCHYSSYLYRCSNTRDSHFCIDCQGCNDCIFSWNLRNKQYCIFNEQLSKEEFERRKAEIIDGKHSTLQRNLQTLAKIYPNIIWKDLNNLNSEHCIGDAMVNSSNCYECYNCGNCNGNRYCIDMSPSEQNVSSMDQTGGGIGELLYNNNGLGGGNYFVRMSVLCRQTSYMTYCMYCYYSKNCFGCTGLKNAEYCIFNKQYTKEEYEELMSRIVEHMKSTGEWGTFFPASTSAFAYNVSLAQFIFPLTKDEVLARGWRWEEQPDLEPTGQVQQSAIADGIDEVSDDICSAVLVCEQSGKKYNIQKAELAFHRMLKQPLPRHHPLVRMNRREKMLNPYQLWPRSCAKCLKDIETSFSPERTERVYCEQCYLAEVY